MMTNSFEFVIMLINLINCQYETIWNDDMNTNDGWICTGNCDFSYLSSNCPNGGSNRCHRVLGGNSWIIRTAQISSYSALRFQFDVNSNNIENGESCKLYIRYDGTDWTKEWFVDTSQTQLYAESVLLTDPSGASNIEISLEVDGDGDDNGKADRCYYDNALLEGIKITSVPTSTPTYIPTKLPTYKPTQAPSYPTKAPSYPTRNPTSTPTKYPTKYPTSNPTKYPTKYPSKYPSSNPTKQPTYTPTNIPTTLPSHISTSTSTGIDVPTRLPTDVSKQSALQSTVNPDVGADKTQTDNEPSVYLLDAILVICGGVICCLLLITVMLIRIYKKRRRKNKNDNENLELSRIVSVSATTNAIEKSDVDKGEAGAIQLAAWLNKIGLIEYYDTFVSNGYGDGKELIAALSVTTNDDLKEMCISKVAHRKLILHQIKEEQHKIQMMERKKEQAVDIIDVNEKVMDIVAEGQMIRENKTTGYESDGSNSLSSDAHVYQTKGSYITPDDVPYILTDK